MTENKKLLNDLRFEVIKTQLLLKMVIDQIGYSFSDSQLKHCEHKAAKIVYGNNEYIE